MKKPALAFPANRRPAQTSCVDQVVGDILSGWRYDISGLSPAMRTDYDQHLSDCSHCRRRQRIARTIDVLLISVSTLSIAAFLLAAFVIHRVEVVSHAFTMHLRLSQTHGVAISLEAVAVAGLIFSASLWDSGGHCDAVTGLSRRHRSGAHSPGRPARALYQERSVRQGVGNRE